MKNSSDKLLLEEIINLIPYYVFWKDVNGNYLGVNELFAKASGFTSGDELIGKKDNQTKWPRETVDFFNETDQQVITNNSNLINVEMNTKFINGEVKTLLMNKVPLVNINNEVLGILGFLTDITEQKNILKEKNKAQKELEMITGKLIQTEKLRALGLMAGGIAHEINNPLTIVSGKANMIKRLINKDEVDKDLIEKHCEDLIETVNRCSSVIQNLKDFSRQTPQDKITQFLLSSSLSSLIKVVNLRAEFKNKINIIERYTDMAISAKKISFEQTIINILENAIYEMREDKSITIYIDNYDGRENGIRISNPGPPIASNILPYIFDPFFTTKPIGIGTGLGLSTCKSLMKSCGGDIFYERYEDMNSFVVTLVV